MWIRTNDTQTEQAKRNIKFIIRKKLKELAKDVPQVKEQEG